jgi:hypothetical protein
MVLLKFYDEDELPKKEIIKKKVTVWVNCEEL